MKHKPFPATAPLIVAIFVLLSCSNMPLLVRAPTPTPTLTPTPMPTQTPTPMPTSLPPSGYLTFDSNLDEHGWWGIYMMKADGTGDRHVLFTHPNENGWSAWSPDGQKIAFVSGRDGNNEIYIMNADGTGLTRLTEDPADDAMPAWSPDGLQIAFESYRDGNYEIYAISVDGLGLKRLTNNPAEDILPSWSPDGQRIAFVSDRDQYNKIYVMDANGNGALCLSRGNVSDSEPAWSPDGQKIAFTSGRDGNAEIYVMNTDGSQAMRLTQNSAADSFPAWSPDGRYIAFNSDRNGNQDIYVMDADGSNVRRITENPADDMLPSWAPVNVSMSDEPWFGAPFCARDTNDDLLADTPTTIFSLADRFAYIAFPFRNMENGLLWGHKWSRENPSSITITMNNIGWWEKGDSGLATATLATSNFASMGSGDIIIQLYIENRLVQEVKCSLTDE